jgi:hypothetical protein
MYVFCRNCSKQNAGLLRGRGSQMKKRIMMKVLILILIVTFSCSLTKILQANRGAIRVLIEFRINSINSYYLIYVKKQDSLFKNSAGLYAGICF